MSKRNRIRDSGLDLMQIDRTMEKADYFFNNHNSICVSVSGGSDSDIIVHIIATNFRQYLNKIHFVFSNTGLEYKATKDHLSYLEEKYDIEIKRLNYKDGVLPIPVAVREYGVPFASKNISEYIMRLQKHGFQWEDDTYENLKEKYPNCESALRWWCNAWGDHSHFNIDNRSHLKELLLSVKPDFQISAICCQKSKKNPLTKYQESINADLLVSGERKIEGGSRATRHKGCFETRHGIDLFMPLFFWNNSTKQYYKDQEKIKYSDCYEVYGLKRTGCVGCPFGQNLNDELEIMKEYEPNLYKACMNVFGKSYDITNQLNELKKKKSGDDDGISD